MNLAASVLPGLGGERALRLAGALAELVGRTDELALDGGLAAVRALAGRGGPTPREIADAARGLGGPGAQVARGARLTRRRRRDV
jgi:hypothetical protein